MKTIEIDGQKFELVLANPRKAGLAYDPKWQAQYTLSPVKSQEPEWEVTIDSGMNNIKVHLERCPNVAAYDAVKISTEALMAYIFNQDSITSENNIILKSKLDLAISIARALLGKDKK